MPKSDVRLSATTSSPPSFVEPGGTTIDVGNEPGNDSLKIHNESGDDIHVDVQPNVVVVYRRSRIEKLDRFQDGRKAIALTVGKHESLLTYEIA